MANKEKVLITGSSRGLGKALANLFINEGHSVVLHGRDEERLNKLISSLSCKDQIEYFVSDLAIPENIDSLSEYAKLKNVQLLINNAGLHCANKNFYDLDEDYINNAIDLNLKAPILLIHKMMGFLNGVININSMSGLENKKLRTIYASSKWGLKGFSECLKKEDLDLKILDVYPSSIKTNVNITYGMDPGNVAKSIYTSYYQNKTELIIDGRK